METLVHRLRDRLAQPLPGSAAQFEMASSIGRLLQAYREDHRESGVLALLYPVGGLPHVALMKRSEDGHMHSGQISFPGGRREEVDADIVATALREAEEEMAIPAADVQVLGRLSRLYLPPSNFMIYPVVGYLPYRPAFVPDPKEVAAVIEAPLHMLLAPSTYGLREVQVMSQRLEVPAFVVHGHIVWGATAMMLNELLHLLRDLGEHLVER
ncbi:MAG: CoA pyrophosphatase [Bacteroidia bacterium]